MSLIETHPEMQLMQTGQIGVINQIIKQISGALSTELPAIPRRSVDRVDRVFKDPRAGHNKTIDLKSIVGTTEQPHTIQRTVGTLT